ncbi:STAS-like domain-containing protein [Reichenbachiella sp. MALMAid0571]|uniref:STAS-like domain-containing protein n=1 Tax=Reichenbachiella sp. MALMAid0571 TaxID=3143939 RepID=UPI0032DF2F7B
MEQVRINIFEAIGGDGAISVDDGDMIYSKVEKAVLKNAQVILDFQNIKLITTAFLNAAIGQLYGNFSTELIKEKLSLENVAQEDLPTFKIVTNRAKQYFLDKKGFENAVNDQLNNG